MSEHTMTEEISSLEVWGLFGRFHHLLSFPEDENVAIVTAPNGFGKTVMLRIIDSLFNRKLHFFWKLPFDKIEIMYKSGKSLTVFRDRNELFEEENIKQKQVISFKATGFGERSDDEIHKLSEIPASLKDLRYLERHCPVERLGPDQWMDHPTDRVLSTDQVINQYADQLPPHLLESLKLPDWLQCAVDSVRTHLVETQRLLSLDQSSDVPRYRRMSKMRPSSVVEKDASDLSERIGDILQQYANEAQKLDQTFPKRIIEFRAGDVESEDKIRIRLGELSDKRDELVSVGLIGKTISQPIQPNDTLKDENIRRILSIYIDDTDKKLGIFDEIYDKIHLFKDILEEHFSFKNIEINPSDGIRAVDDNNNEAIPLSELSSGEQHELILIYELLFKVKEGSLILIDEPELSLHVAWQKKFISDIQKIQKIKNIKVIIATHSPQIINKKWNLVQELTA